MDTREFTTLLHSYGATLSANQLEVIIEHPEGQFMIDLTTATVRLTLAMCAVCEAPCKEVRSICIVSDGLGWSNCTLTERQMEILSKVMVLSQSPLPIYVRNRIPRGCPQLLPPAQGFIRLDTLDLVGVNLGILFAPNFPKDSKRRKSRRSARIQAEGRWGKLTGDGRQLPCLVGLLQL